MHNCDVNYRQGSLKNYILQFTFILTSLYDKTSQNLVNNGSLYILQAQEIILTEKFILSLLFCLQNLNYYCTLRMTSIFILYAGAARYMCVTWHSVLMIL